MKEKENAKTCHISVMVTPEEYARLQVDFGKTTYRFFSQYIRKILLRKPATLHYRNASLDEFLPVALQMKNELEEIRKSYTQILKTIQSISPDAEAAQTVQFLLSEAVILNHNIERIRTTLINISEKCTG